MARFTFAILALLLGLGIPSAAQDDCRALYEKVTANYKGDALAQKTAYDAAVAYVARCKTATNTEQVNWVTRFKSAYEGVVEREKLNADILNSQKANDWPRNAAALARARQAYPDNVIYAYRAGMLGMWSRSKAFYSQSVEPARAMLRMIDAGELEKISATASEVNFGKDMTRGKLTGQLNYALGYYLHESDPKQARLHLKAALKADDSYKQNSYFFELLSVTYQSADYTPLTSDYKICVGSEAPQCLINKAKMTLIVQGIVDAEARAYVLATDPKRKAALRTNLEAFYKFQHRDSLAGLDEMLKTILSKPIPYM